MNFPTDRQGREARREDLHHEAAERARRQVENFNYSPNCSGQFGYVEHPACAAGVERRRVGPGLILAIRTASGFTIDAIGLDTASRGKIKRVNARRGKILRAAPVAALFGDPDRSDEWLLTRIHLAGSFPKLEAENDVPHRPR